MNHTWGVYNLQGKLADGREVAGDDRAAVKWFVRWRVDGHARKRTFAQKGHAKAFREHLTAAKFKGWAADDRGWPLDPDAIAAETVLTAPVRAMTFEDYCEAGLVSHQPDRLRAQEQADPSRQHAVRHPRTSLRPLGPAAGGRGRAPRRCVTRPGGPGC